MSSVLLLQVALTNLLLSGDNVLLIALMSKGVRRGGRWAALSWSLLVSVALQLGILALMAVLFRFSVVHAVFGALICLVAFHLVHSHRPHLAEAPPRGVPETVARITVGNLLMSFENEAALISLAGGNALLAWTGVLLTAPIIFFGSHAVSWVLQRYTIIVYASAIYLVHIGLRLVFSVPALRAYGVTMTWLLTALFAAYAAAVYVTRLRSMRPTSEV